MRRVTALDIGSSGIKMAVADVEPSSKTPMIQGFVHLPSRGIKNGMIIDVDAATAVIREAKLMLEKQIDGQLENCYISISGDHITGINTTARISLTKDNAQGLSESTQISIEDIKRLEDHTRGFVVSADRDVLHHFPIEYIIDGRKGTTTPVNQYGRRLQVNVHLTTCELSAIKNINLCCENVGLKIKRYVAQSFASAEGTLTDEEKERGVVLMDIGSGVTDIIIFHNNSVHYTGTLNLAGDMVTNDIHYLTATTLEQAEKVKLNYGFATDEIIEHTETHEIEGLVDRKSTPVTNKELAQYIKARLDEILSEAWKKASETEIINKIQPIICLCGGTALLRGFDKVADNMFTKSPLKPNITRIGVPTGFTSNKAKELTSPEYTCLVGLLKFGARQKEDTLGEKLVNSMDLWTRFVDFIKTKNFKNKK